MEGSCEVCSRLRDFCQCGAYPPVKAPENEIERLREQIEYAFREGWNACEGDGKRQSTVNGAWYAYRRTLPDALREVKA